MIANIALDDGLILPHSANPTGSNFRERQAVILAAGGTVTPLAAKAATATIPIVFVIGADPVKAGLVSSFNRPAGNITGVTMITALVITKRVGLMRELLPAADMFALLLNS